MVHWFVFGLVWFEEIFSRAAKLAYVVNRHNEIVYVVNRHNKTGLVKNQPQAKPNRMLRFSTSQLSNL